MKRNHTIDVLKGIAIILVLITHYEWTQEQRKIFVFPFIVNMAIPVFMIITGYVYSLSLEKQNIQHLEDAYPWKSLLKRSIRYTLPVIAVIIWDLCDPHFSVNPDPLERLRWAINGTAGKGNYYYPVMMQLIFVFPLIYFEVNRKKEWGLLLAFFANAVYELLVWAYGIPTGSYRLLVFRYIFLIAAGVCAYKGYKLPIWLSLLMTVLGALFISSIIYFGYEPKMVNKDWATVDFIASMWIIPLMIWLLQNAKIRFLPLEIIGKASYHIFLVQMVYYSGYYTELQGKVSTRQGHMILGVGICLAIGVSFYYVEQPIQNWLQQLIRKSEKTEISERA